MNQQQILEIVTKETHLIAMKKVANDQQLLSTKMLDSMALVDLAISLEAAFNIKIDARDMIPQNFETIDNIAGYVGRSLS